MQGEPIPDPDVRQVNYYLMCCPSCAWAKEFKGGSRRYAEVDYRAHYRDAHNTDGPNIGSSSAPGSDR